MNSPLFHGMDFINTDRPEMVFASIPLSVQESVAVLRETPERNSTIRAYHLYANSDRSVGFSSLKSISESSLDLIIAVLLDLLTSCLSD